MTMVAILALMAVVVGAQAPTPKDLDKQTAKKVVELLEHNHMARPTIDDEIAKKWCKYFLRDLDPQKYYFEKADVDEFTAQATMLDDQIRQGDLSFATRVFDRYRKRSDERYATVLELLKQKPDFTTDDSIIDDPDLYDYPVDAKEANERWRKKIKFDLLQLKVLDKLEGEEAANKVRVRYKDRNRFTHQVDMSELLEYYLTSLTKTFDPHSNYLSPKSMEDMEQLFHLSLEGIGASLLSEDGYRSSKRSSPAWRPTRTVDSSLKTRSWASRRMTAPRSTSSR